MKKVIIVGAGPAGATAAFLLAQQGILVTLVEKEPTFDRIFRGEALMPLGLEALKQMGLHKMLQELPQRLIRSWDMNVGNKRIFQVFEPQDELGDQAVRVVAQPPFLERVTEMAAQYEGFILRMGCAVRDLVWENGRVSGVTVVDENGREETLLADLVLGCDGRGSIARTRADIKLNLLPESYDLLWFRFPTPKHLHGTTDVLMMGTVKHTALAYNSHDDHIRYALLLPKGGLQKYRNANWQEEMAEPAPPWLAEHILSLPELEKPLRLNVIVGRSETWTVPGLLLLGDAAHPMSPIRAQGINLALRDVIVMANHLAPLLRSGATHAAIDAVLQVVADERLPEIKRAQALQLREAKGQSNERLRPLMIGMAKATGPIFGRFAWAQKAWLSQQKDLRFGTAEVNLQL